LGFGISDRSGGLHSVLSPHHSVLSSAIHEQPSRFIHHPHPVLHSPFTGATKVFIDPTQVEKTTHAVV